MLLYELSDGLLGSKVDEGRNMKYFILNYMCFFFSLYNFFYFSFIDYLWQFLIYLCLLEKRPEILRGTEGSFIVL